MIARALLLSLASFFPWTASAALPFPVAAAQFREVDETYAAEGLVEAVRQSTVAAQIAGRIVALEVDVGDFVQKGQVIARIDESVVGAQATGSQAQVDQARALLENARAQYERAKQLHAQKFISQAALDKAAAEYKAAQAQAQAALAGASAAGATRRFAVLAAPFSGVVAARHVELGELALPGKPVLTLFDPRELRVEVSVPQYKLAAVRSHMRAKVELPTTNTWLPARRITVLPVADARTHVTRVRLDLPESPRGVYPGMFARAHFAIGRAAKLLVPRQAVLRRSELTAVYVVDAKERLHLRQIRLGESAGENEVEVLAGLAPGEKVALDPVAAGIRLATTGQRP